jgi:hypothetical protein
MKSSRAFIFAIHQSINRDPGDVLCMFGFQGPPLMGAASCLQNEEISP